MLFPARFKEIFHLHPHNNSKPDWSFLAAMGVDFVPPVIYLGIWFWNTINLYKFVSESASQPYSTAGPTYVL